MRRLNSAEFKREYKSLTEPVLVTVGDKSLGVWTPTIKREPDFYDGQGTPSVNQVPARSAGSLPPWRSSVPFPEEPRWD